MGRKKQVKKDEFNAFANCFNDDRSLAGKWNTHFGNEHPLIVELGCGKGDLSLGLARQHPEMNYLGVDIKATRMWSGAWAGLEEGLENLAFLRTDIHGIQHYFGPGEIDGLWITFPDPYPKKKQSKNRMIHERFLRQYTTILKPGATIWFKTDNNSLFEYCLAHFEELNQKKAFAIEVLEQTRDLHASPLRNPSNGVVTDFEQRFLDIGKKINYMAFTLEAGPNIEQVPVTEGLGLDPTEKAPTLRT